MSTAALAVPQVEPRHVPPPAPRGAQHHAVLAGILLLGTALRLYGVFAHPFEEDELYTIIESSRLFASPFEPGIDARPLYFLLQHAASTLLPASHLGMRLLPLLFGVLGIAATWKVGRYLFGAAGALGAAFCVAVSPFHLHVSEMARYGALLYLLATLFLFYVLRATESGRPRDYLAALLALVLGASTHPTFLFPVMGIALGLCLVRDDGSLGWAWPPRRAWTHLWIPFALFLAAAYTLLSLTGRAEEVRNFDGRGWAATLRLLPAIVEWLTPIAFVAGAVGAIVLVVGAGGARARRAGMVALLGVLSTLALLFAAAFQTNVYADYAVVMLPLVFVAAGGLLRGQRLPHAAAALLVLLGGVLPSLVSHVSDGMRYDYRPALRDIAAADASLPVVTPTIAIQRYYAPALHGIELKFDGAWLDGALAADPDLWLTVPIGRRGIVLDGKGEVARWLERHCRSIAFYERPRFDYRMYRVGLYRCAREPAALD